MSKPDPAPLKSPNMESIFSDRFADYFKRPIVVAATKSLSDGVEIEIQICERDEKTKEIFCLKREIKLNVIRPGPGDAPHVIMKLTPQAAVELLANPSENIGEIGIQCAAFVASSDPKRKLELEFKSGILTLVSKGFVGVVLAGGKTLGGYLATKGLDGMGAIKAIISKFKK